MIARPAVRAAPFPIPSFRDVLTASANVTVPLPPVLPVLHPPIVPPSPVTFPIGWLLEHGAAPIRYRSAVDVARLPRTPGDALGSLPYTYEPALLLAMQQQPDGSWNRSMLDVPSSRAEKFEGVGTINAVRRLIEFGWDREAPPLALARRLLFRMLAEDDDPAYLFELAPRGPRDDDVARRGRTMLREAAAAALAQCGYEGDPRLRGAARRIIERVNTYLKSPVAQKPWVRVGNRQVLAQEAAPPSIHTLTMLAHMPLFRNEHHEQLDRIYHYITQAMPRQESVQICGRKIIVQPQLVLGDMLPHRNAVDADVPFAMMWLELMARLNFLRRNENWTRLFDRFLDDRDREGVWHPHKGMAMPRTTNPYVWPSYPLERHSAGEERWADLTFRLGLIARLSGRPIELR